MLSNCYCRVEFFDIFYNLEEKKEEAEALRKYVVIRGTRVNLKIIEETIGDFQDVCWLDDMYCEGNDARANYNNLKCKILKETKPRVAVIKIMLDCVSLYPVGPSVTYFKTPISKPFSPVREVRCVVTSSTGVDFAHGDTNLIEAEERHAWEAAMALQELEEWLEDHPPRERPNKPKFGGGSDRAPRGRGKRGRGGNQ
jgi:hypothetical protein